MIYEKEEIRIQLLNLIKAIEASRSIFLESELTMLDEMVWGLKMMEKEYFKG